MPDGAGEAFTLFTTEPGPDVAPIHNRQMVVLDRSDWLAWLDLTHPEAKLLRPLPAGSLTTGSRALRRFSCIISTAPWLGSASRSPIKPEPAS